MSQLPHILLAQLNPTVGDLGGNLDKMRAVRDNAPQDTDIIVFPELMTCGYPADDLVLKPDFIDSIESMIGKLVVESSNHRPYLIVSTPWRDGRALRNAALVIGNGKIQFKTYKHILPNDGVFDEKRVFDAGPLPKPYVFRDTKIGIMTCEDMWHPHVSNHLASMGAEILVVPNASPYHTQVHEQRLMHAKIRNQDTGLPMIYVNQVGGQDELVFDGGSFIMDATGAITHELPLFEEALLSTVDAPILRSKTTELRAIYSAVTLGLKDYVTKNGFPGVLIGLSGGIDSALSAAIAVDALGAENVHCVMMPSPYTSQESRDDAAQCAALLGVRLDTIAIEPAMKAYEAMLHGHVDSTKAGTTFENIQSRARGMTLMALSNANGKMVLSTGNKSEMAVGYATLYGDMCGGFNALKDLYKGQVYALSEWRNKQSLVIPKRIITKAPSAELKPNQTDQDSLPPYDILDDILECLIEKDLGPDDIKHPKELVQRVWRMLDMAEYKRRQAPPGVKITPKAFGRNRRYPITNKFRG
ncbi:MAG: NAD+ synthase [Alphaproteobacteria bacterium]|nr:NAD+ synthase [Alphaproteobacteria bacterium]NCQ87741.1 NAD+ synthase [Alphaproteobacteria bacterium]NCT05751.1 NAD+ synthase [Alphaproteobacteria bacterium]